MLNNEIVKLLTVNKFKSKKKKKKERMTYFLERWKFIWFVNSANNEMYTM